MQVIHPQQLLDQAELVHPQQVVADAITRLSHEVKAKLADACPVVICVMNGGLVFAGQLLTQLDFALEVDYVHASRYQNNIIGQTLTWQVLPRVDLTDRTVLLLDDILDEGITLNAIREKCLSLGATSVLTAVLVEKKLDHAKPIQADFIGLEVPNRYVFGFGMDAYGWWRNLPAIYALP